MVERRRGQLDLAAVLELLVQWNHLGHDVPLLGQQPLLVGFRVVTGLLAELLKLGVLFE